jgi:hypothetical protein
MTLQSWTQKIKLKFFEVIREFIVVMVATSKNMILLPILLILMGMLLLVIGIYTSSIIGLISPPLSSQTIAILAIIAIAYIGVGVCLIVLTAIYTRRILKSSNKIIETTKLIKKDTDKEDLLKIQSVIIENLEESIDKKDGCSDGSQER